MSIHKIPFPIEDSWYKRLKEEFEKPYFKNIIHFLDTEKEKGKTIFPEESKIFNAFNSTPFNQVKTVILGQDPYHGAGQAMGLSFSVPRGIRIPPSLRNIYKELNRSTDFKIPDHGDLSPWTTEGVFLLNTILTVEAGKPGSHATIGWEIFTDRVIEILSDQKDGLVFLLWGNHARSKKNLINPEKHFILESRHPSPLAGKGFYGNNHFADSNEYLRKSGKKAVNWELERSDSIL